MLAARIKIANVVICMIQYMSADAAVDLARQLRQHGLVLGLGTGCSRWASTEMPKNSEPRMAAIHTRVVDAFFDSGFLNALTPLEIASTPVSATAPDENARISKKKPTPLANSRVLADLLDALGVLGDRSRGRRRTTATDRRSSSATER